MARKRCPRCRRMLPLAEFPPRPGGRPKAFCRSCLRALARLEYDAIMADPERRQRRTESERIYRAARRRDEGTPALPTPRFDTAYRWKPPPVGGRGAPLVDVGPLRMWLLHVYRGWAVKEIADHLGEDDRHIWRILRRQERVSLYVADRILVAADRPDLVSTFWPLPIDEEE